MNLSDCLFVLLGELSYAFEILSLKNVPCTRL